MKMIEGSRQLPTMNVSVRVPWHDSQWNGTICSNPCGNTSCLILPRIADTRNDDQETELAGSKWDEGGESLPACAAERGAFMSPFGYNRSANHPYQYDQRYKHFRETNFFHEKYSAAAIPFGWMLKAEKNGLPEPAKSLDINFDPELEPDNISGTWVQHKQNQLAMLDTFFGAIKPKESLVFFYAKNTPLTVDSRRVIIGIGRVLEVDSYVEYEYSNIQETDVMRSVLWERNLHHSIRPKIKDGFLMPYHELLARAEKDSKINLADMVLHAPEEYWDSFSWGAEHVTHDQAIAVLLSCNSLIDKWETVLPKEKNWKAARTWINEQLNRLWHLRGAFPGLGSALTALGLSHGTLIAYEIGQMLHNKNPNEIGDPWPLVEKILQQPELLPNNLAGTLGPSALKLWNNLPEERLALLKLLARFEITADQAVRWFNEEERKEANINVADKNILENPYICFEADIWQSDPISIGMIDRGLFPDKMISDVAPLPQPSRCNENTDQRRGRALMIDRLNQSAIEGHTLLPQDWLLKQVRTLEISNPCPIRGDWVNAHFEFLTEEGKLVSLKLVNEVPAWQLSEYKETREIISHCVQKRLKGKRHSGDEDWRLLIDRNLKPLEEIPDQEAEISARDEKTKALEEIYRSRFSVLIGPAGTGKTSLLTTLLSIKSIESGGVLLLAPTGKARVQIEQRAKKGEKASTLAQFLLRLKRYDPDTGRYYMTGDSNRESGYKTVIIDECSMLTEDQLAATIDAIAGVERLILVGDYRQLPPIGAGRPFFDIVRYLKEQNSSKMDKPTPGYAELKIIRRQSTDVNESTFVTRDDILLSRWFGGSSSNPSDDEIWNRLFDGTANRIKAIEWESDSDLQEKLYQEITETTESIARELDPENENPENYFEISLGGRSFKDRVYFHPSQDSKGGATDVENWQILSPIRAGESGVEGLNWWIRKSFRHQIWNWVRPNEPWQRKVPEPMGAQGLLYGDKVINVINKLRTARSRGTRWEKEKLYLANGEIGLAVGQYKNKNLKKLPWKLEVEFSTQPESKFDFNNWEFGEENPLELAYALTIHKAQGSEFNKTFVVIPNPCRLLSRELLYTALTRQSEEIVLFHQKNLHELINYSSDYHSETAGRFTNLFEYSNPIEYNDKFFDDNLIHRTTKGELVRSKSEVIIANALHTLGIDYTYEKQYKGDDGSVRYPDFTIEDAETGQIVYLEHLGMLSDSTYQKKWEEKLDWYRSQGIFPEGEGEGHSGMLITTTEEGGIDSASIEKKLRSIFGI